jgi:hypothetical protein
MRSMIDDRGNEDWLWLVDGLLIYTKYMVSLAVDLIFWWLLFESSFDILSC